MTLDLTESKNLRREDKGENEMEREAKPIDYAKEAEGDEEGLAFAKMKRSSCWL